MIDDMIDMEDFVDEEFFAEERQPDPELYEHWRMVVDPGQELMRIDKFLMDHVGYTSRNRIQKAAEAECIRVNGCPVRSSYRVKPGEVITLVLDRPRREWRIEAEDIPIEIVYEDDELMVINKSAGMVVHPGVDNFTGTLVNAVAWHMKMDKRFDPNDPTVGMVHRIDKDTSGLIVVAKTARAKTGLCQQFSDHTTDREYNALVWGNFYEDTGTIEGNIARNPKDRLQMTVFPPDSGIGKPAITHYEVMERFDHVTLVRCRLETGRTHQIRVHMRSIGHTLFNDERYGGNEILWGERSSSYNAFIHNCFTVCPRQALHAATLGFTHPATRERMFFSAPLPEDMQTLLDKWRRRV